MTRLDILRSRVPKVVRDIAARAAWTYLQAFAAVFLASGVGVKAVAYWPVVAKASAAGVVAALSVLKSLATAQLGKPGQVATR